MAAAAVALFPVRYKKLRILHRVEYILLSSFFPSVWRNYSSSALAFRKRRACAYKKPVCRILPKRRAVRQTGIFSVSYGVLSASRSSASGWDRKIFFFLSLASSASASLSAFPLSVQKPTYKSSESGPAVSFVPKASQASSGSASRMASASIFVLPVRLL